MSNYQRKFNHKMNKFAGGIKEAAGKVSGNEQLELKGKLQSSKADFKKSTNMKDKIESIKEGVTGKINDKIDKNKKRRK